MKINEDRFLSDRVKQLPESSLWNFFNEALYIEDVVSLSLGEPDFETPIHIADEGIRAIREGHTYYAPTLGLAKLRHAIISYYKRRFKVSHYKEENVIVTVGVSEAIDLVCRSILNEGDECIVLDPGYVAYAPLVELTGATVKRIEVFEENGFKLTSTQLKNAINERTKMIILNYPTNPTGAVMEYEDYLEIVKILKEHHIIVVSDEIYLELSYGVKPCSLGNFEELKDQLVILNGYSKAYSMTGWRIGYAIAPVWMIDGMKRIHQYCTMGPTTPSQFAAIEASSIYGDRDIEEHRSKFLMRRNYVVKRLNEIGLKTNMPHGAFYVFANIKHTNLTSFEFARRLLLEEKVCVIPGSAFGKGGEGFVRISYAYSKKQLEDAIIKIDRFLKRLNEEEK